MNGIQLLIVPDNLLCKLDQESPVCLQQLGHLDMFDLHKEFILCTYSGRLEEIKKKKKIQISFTYLEYFLRELRQSSLGQWGTSVPLSYFCQCSARCRKPSSVLISVAVLLWFKGNTAGIVPVKSFQNVRQQRTYLMEVWRAFDNVDTIPTHPQRTWYLEGCFVKQDWMSLAEPTSLASCSGLSFWGQDKNTNVTEGLD